MPPRDRGDKTEPTDGRHNLSGNRDVVEGGVARRRVRAFLAVEAASFLLAASVHAGVSVRGYEHPDAMIAETVIGVVLLVGLAATWGRELPAFTVATGVQVFALLGTLVGIGTILAGFGPRTVPDVAYHVGIVLVLGLGIATAWRSRGTKSP